MTALVISAAVIGVYVWLLFRAQAQAGYFRPLPVGKPHQPRKLAIIVPVRNEEAVIAECLHDLVAQDLAAEMREIIVVDDASTDRTCQIVARYLGSGLKLVHAPSLPSGWTGKAHACWFGAMAASPFAQDLVFIDADVRCATNFMSCAVALAERDRIAFLSIAPRLALTGVAERLVLPCGLYVLAFLQDLKDVEAGRDARATGQFMLVDRDLYTQIGGHAAVGGQICEDLALARLAFGSGARVEMRDGNKLASVRMYDRWRTLRSGLSKNILEILGGPRRACLVPIVAIMLSWAPLAILFATLPDCHRSGGLACAAAAISGGALLLAVAFHTAGALHFGIPIWYGLCFPIGYALCALLSLDALIKSQQGRTEWKGRIYTDAS